MALLITGFDVTDGPLPLWTRFGEEVTINSPVDGDVYVAGQNVTINAPVRGDLIVAGGNVVVNDSVTMDVLVGAGTVTINGHIGDDIRCAGGNIVVAGTIKGDAMITAGELQLRRAANLGGNLIAYGGVLSIDGNVGGSVKVAGGEVIVRGVIDGSIDLAAETIEIAGIIKGSSIIAANTIIVKPTARFDKDIKFWNDAGSLSIPSDVAHGDFVFDPALEIKRGRWELLGFASVLVLLWYLGTALIMIMIIEYLFSKTFMNAAKVALNESVKSLGYGFLFFIGIPVVGIALVVTVLGIPLAVILLILYAILAILATAIAAIVIANWLNTVYYKSEWKVSRIALVAFGIFVILKFITLTPVVGPAIMILIVCMAFGSIVVSVRKKFSGDGSIAPRSI